MAKPTAVRPVTVFVYSVKFVCGIQKESKEPTVVRPGIYSTDINIFNFNRTKVSIIKNLLPLVINGDIKGREPKFVEKITVDNIVLPPECATFDDCFKIAEFLHLSFPFKTTIGFLEIVSEHELDVTAVYTVNDLETKTTSIHVNQIQGRKVVI